jgi:uncharacterized protein DUF3455
MRRSAVALLLSAIAIPAIAAPTEPAGVSEKLRPSADEQLAFVLKAQGVQVYACKQKDAYAYAWSFVAPEATLSEGGTTVGRHYAGPTWESSSDGSMAKGAVRERQDGGYGNIPWLLLGATPASPNGKFAGVTSIQRVATHGGVEPTEACNEYNANREMRVAYTADYYFYKRK